MKYQIVDAAYVEQHLHDTPIVDVRPHQLYVEGHIPGAINAELLAAKEAPGDTAVVFVDEMTAQGVQPEEGPIIYCQDGKLAKEACDLLEGIGYTNQKCYEGSYPDWISDPSRPIEK